MNSSFLATLMAVLSDQDEIENLPNDKLIASELIGEPLESAVTMPIFLKIARLQTLAFRAHEIGEMPSFDSITQISGTTGGDAAKTIADSLGVKEDATRRIMMIERLIVEIVREAVPAECERNNVEYFGHLSGVIMRRATNSQRFLD